MYIYVATQHHAATAVPATRRKNKTATYRCKKPLGDDTNSRPDPAISITDITLCGDGWSCSTAQQSRYSHAGCCCHRFSTCSAPGHTMACVSCQYCLQHSSAKICQAWCAGVGSMLVVNQAAIDGTPSNGCARRSVRHTTMQQYRACGARPPRAPCRRTPLAVQYAA